MSYAIWFDFPEVPDPWFAGKVGDTMALVSNIADATKWDSSETAERVLAGFYGEGTRPFGTVVEVLE